MNFNGIRAPHEAQDSTSASFGFALVIIYLFFDYGRPQDLVGVIGALKPGLIVTLLLTIAWLTHRNFRTVASPQLTCMILMLFLMTLHIPLAANWFFAYKATESYLMLLPFCISVVLFVDRIERLRTYVKWWNILAAYIAVNGILGGGIAGSSFLGDENDFSLLMNVMLPFALCLFQYERKWFVKLAYLTTSLLCVVSIVTSHSRGGFVGLIAALAVIGLASSRKFLTLVLVGILALGVYVSADQKYWDRMSTIDNTDDPTAKERMDSWQVGWDMFKDHPLGVGPGNFGIRFPEYQGDSFGRNMWGRVAHSLWITLLSELGIPGLLLFLALLRCNMRDLWYIRRVSPTSDNDRFVHFLSVAFMASFAGFFASATFLSVLYYPHYWYLTAMIVATRKIIGSNLYSTEKHST